MTNRFVLFIKSPVQNTKVFTQETARFAKSTWKGFFSKKRAEMAEDFHAFAKHESEHRRNGLAIFYLNQEIRSLNARIKACGNTEDGLKDRLFQAYCNLAAIHFGIGTESSLNKARKCFKTANYMIPQLGFEHQMRKLNGAPLSEASTKALYLNGMLKPALGEAKSALRNYEQAEIPDKIQLGQLCFLIGELNFELGQEHDAKVWYEKAMEYGGKNVARWNLDPIIDLARERLWNFNYFYNRTSEVAAHNKEVHAEWREEKKLTDPWDPPQYEYTHRKTGEVRYTDPSESYPNVPKPKYEKEKMDYLRECPITKTW